MYWDILRKKSSIAACVCSLIYKTSSFKTWSCLLWKNKVSKYKNSSISQYGVHFFYSTWIKWVNNTTDHDDQHFRFNCETQNNLWFCDGAERKKICPLSTDCTIAVNARWGPKTGSFLTANLAWSHCYLQYQQEWFMLPTQQRQCQSARDARTHTHTQTSFLSECTWHTDSWWFVNLRRQTPPCVFSSLLSGLQIRPRRNLIWWVSKCRQPAGFYGDGTCRTVDHFPPKKMHQQHSFISDINKNGDNSPTTVANNT